MCKSEGKLTLGYQLYTGVSSLLTALYCTFAMGTNNLKDEYHESRDEDCKQIWYYLLSMTVISGAIGLFILGFLGYRCLCQTLCRNEAELEFTCKRCCFLSGYIGLNFWGYFVAILTPSECFSHLKESYPRVFAAFIIYNAIFTINIIYVLLLVFTRLCRKRNLSLLEQVETQTV